MGCDGQVVTDGGNRPEKLLSFNMEIVDRSGSQDPPAVAHLAGGLWHAGNWRPLRSQLRTTSVTLREVWFCQGSAEDCRKATVPQKGNV